VALIFRERPKKNGILQITLLFQIQRGLIAIPKTVTKARVLENGSIFDFALDEEDCRTLAKFDNGYRTVPSPFFQEYDNFPFDKTPGLKVPIPPSLLKWKNGANLDID
jgi:diketogulonate reductase-like aldo/keto reductase